MQIAKINTICSVISTKDFISQLTYFCSYFLQIGNFNLFVNCLNNIVHFQQAQNNASHSHPSPPTVSSTQHHYGAINSPIKVPQVSSSTGGPDSTFTVPDDVGMGFEGGVRVLQSLGNWYVFYFIINQISDPPSTVEF